MATTAQQTALALAPKFSAGLGLPSGMIVAYYISGDQASQKANPMLRALLSVSCYEILDAMAWFLSTWAAPRESQWVWASGTQASCSFQGFWLQFVIGAPLSSCAISFYFYLVVSHGKTLEYLAKMEGWILTGIFLYSLTTAILMLVLDQYNHIGAVCYIQGSPPLCGNSIYTPNPDVPCERGDWAWVYGMVLFYIPLWACYICIFYFNMAIYWQIRSSEEGSWFATQSLLYSLAFCITWAPSTVWSGLQWKNGGIFWVDLASAIFEPLAGFWNLLIFLRIRPHARQDLKRVLFCCNWGKEDGEEHELSGEERYPAGAGRLSDESTRQKPGELKFGKANNKQAATVAASQRTGMDKESGTVGWALQERGEHYHHWKQRTCGIADSTAHTSSGHIASHESLPSLFGFPIATTTTPIKPDPWSPDLRVSSNMDPANLFHDDRPRRAHYHQQHKSKQHEFSQSVNFSTTGSHSASTSHDDSNSSNSNEND